MRYEPVPVWRGPDGLELDKERLTKLLKQSAKDRQFLEEHLAEWYEKYADKYVAVYKEALAGVAATPQELVADLESKGIPSNESCWQFLSTKPIKWVLPG